MILFFQAQKIPIIVFLPFRNDVQDVFIKTYYPTHIRLVPWLFGSAYAYYMNKSQGRKPKWSIVCIINVFLLS